MRGYDVEALRTGEPMKYTDEDKPSDDTVLALEDEGVYGIFDGMGAGTVHHRLQLRPLGIWPPPITVLI